MLNTLFLFLAPTRLFWKARRALSRLVFFNYRMLFGVKHRIREESTTTKSLLSLLWSIRGQLALAIVITSLLQFFNPHLVPWFTEQGFTIPKDSYYGTLIATFTSIGGIFIGFYYAAISVVCGAIYARVPNNIRNLLAQEQVGNAYMRLLALLTFSGLCLLAFHTVGLEPVILGIPLLVLGAGLMIIGFVQLGARVFHLFDPTILSSTIFKQLQQCCTQMRAGGYRWSDPSFQQHAHRRAQNAIDTLNILADIAAKEPHLNGQRFTGLCQNLLLFLRAYEIVKKTIPTNSLWYRQRYVHQDWYRTGDTETSIAHDTATGLQPKPVSDPRWIEAAILPIVKRCLEINIRNKRYALANKLLSDLAIYIQQLAKEQQVESAFNLIRDVFSHCAPLIFVENGRVVAEEPLEHMQICQQLTIMPINVLRAYTCTIESYGRGKILQRIRHITWKSGQSIYKAGFAVHILTQLEWLHPRLGFEERVEGWVISPSWYIQELIAQQEAKNFLTAMNFFYEETCDLYKHWIEKATSSTHPWLAAVIISTELDYWNKLDYHIDALSHFWSDLNSDRKIKNLLWPSLNIDKLVEKGKQREKELLKLMSTENILLSLISKPESYPDFAGQFLHNVGEALLTAMCENDCDMVDALFKSYFYGSSLQFEQLKPKEAKSDWQSQIDLKIAVAPLLDLMDISGYAYLLSDYHGTPRLKETIVKVWDEYLDQDSTQPRLEFFAAAVSLTESAFEIAHRGINRTKWMQVIERRLSSVEGQEVNVDSGGILSDTETVVIHESPLVRVLAKNRELSYDGIDIFLAKYVCQREDGGNLDFGRSQYRDLEEAIRIEENRGRMDE